MQYLHCPLQQPQIMTEQLTRLGAKERLTLYVDFDKNRTKYSPEERMALDLFFEDE